MKVKRLLALVLSLVLTLTVFAMPVAAADDSEAAPYATVIPCPKCGGSASFVRRASRYTGEAQSHVVNGELHWDNRQESYDIFSCSNCGQIKMNYSYRWVCP